MPTTNYAVTTIGQAWALAVADWETYVVDLTATFAIQMNNVAPVRQVQTTITIGGVSTIKIYNVLEVEQFTGMAVTNYLRSPGMRSMPKALQPLYGARNTLNEWRNVMVAFRRTTMCGAMGITAKSLRSDTHDCSPVNYDVYMDFWAVVKHGLCGMDSTLLTLYQGDWAWTLIGDQQPSDGLCGGSQGVLIDASGIVQGLNDIAKRDITAFVDNGETSLHIGTGDIES